VTNQHTVSQPFVSSNPYSKPEANQHPAFSYNPLTNQPGFPVAFGSSGCRGPAGELTPVRAAGTKVECRRHKRLGRPEKIFKIGPSKMKLPELIIIHYHTQTQRKIKLAPAVPDSCLPLGMTPDQNETKLVAVQPGNMLAFLCKILCSLNYSLLLYGVHVHVDHVMARLIICQANF